MPHAHYTNEPSGTTLINETSHNAIVGSGWTDVYDTTGYQTTIVSDATAPYSPNNVMRQRFLQGLIGGNGGGGGNFCQFSTNYPQGIFWGFDMKLDPNFEHQPSGTKVAWIHTSGNNFFLTFHDYGGNTVGIHLNYQWPDNQPSNAHLGFVGSGYLTGSQTFQRGSWCRFEWLYVPSSTPSSRNGTYALWMDGLLSCRTDQLNNPAGLYPNAISHISIWGGVGGVKTRESYLYVDHSYASALSGGTVPPVLAPTIASITPTSGPVGTPLTIVGSNFDADAVGNVVTVNGATATVLAATTTQLNTAIPNTATSGSVQVVTSGGTATAPVSFTVTAPDPGGGTGGGTGGGAGATTNTFSTDFSSTQGPRWYYLNEDGSQMTYSSGLWSGNQTYKGIWSSGFHPGTSTAAVVKYVVPGAGSVRITGSYSDLDTAGGNGVTCVVKKNGASVSGGGPFTIANGDTTGTAYDITNTVVAGDYFTFEVDPIGSNTNDSTNLNPVVVYTPQPQVEEVITLALTSLAAYEQTTNNITLTITPTRATESIVLLSSSLPTTATIPASVTIAANTGSTSVPVTVGLPGTSTVTATLGTSSTTTTVTALPAADSQGNVTVSPTLSAYTDFLLSYRWF